MIILGIETSCDETSIAIIEDGRKVLSNVVYSQIQNHEIFGGVVPEIASRNHILKISLLTQHALDGAKIKIEDIEGIAVTNRPGLIGALLVGVSFAKGLSYRLKVPLIGINHLEAHLYSIFLEEEIPFPFLGLTVSGGHTNLTIAEDFFCNRIVGNTYDDAAGEVYDKVAKMLNLGYPGGPVIEKAALLGNPQAINFPKPLMKSKNIKDRFNFSFSGLKTAVKTYIDRGTQLATGDIAASFQSTVNEVLVKKLFEASKFYNINNVVLAGGVACNKDLRNRIIEKFNGNKYNIGIPSIQFCTDNAAMVAFLGSKYIENGKSCNLSMGAEARSDLC